MTPQQLAEAPWSGCLMACDLDIAGLAVRNARLRYADAQAGTVHLVEDFNFSTGRIRFGQPVAINLDARLRTGEPETLLAVKLGGSVDADLENALYTVPRLTLELTASGADIPGGEQTVNIDGAVRYSAADGGLNIDGGRLRAAGITADFNISCNPTAGWDVVWPIQAYATGPANWHQMSQFWMGMADSSGGYDAWLSETPSLRAPFLVVTRDLRFPQGVTRALQISDSNRAGFRTFTGTPYVRNRQAGEDQPGNPLQISMYDFYRSRSFFTSGRIAPYPIMTAAEIRLLAAEGYLRQNNFTQAINLINVSRGRLVSNTRIQTGVDTLGNPVFGPVPTLDSIPTTIADTLTPLPGGARCVPRVPDPATGYQTSKCGNVWDALKWEYRMETAYTGYGMWYFAGRGWGDLPEGTALYWPVPYQEMDTRRQAFYPAGGPGQTGGAPQGNYGLYAGGVY